MAMIRWLGDSDLFSQFDRMQRDMDRLMYSYRSGTGSTPTGRSGLYPPINIYDDGESFTVRAEAPGVDPDKLDLSVTGNTLTFRGVRKAQDVPESCCYHRQERESGEFRRALTLPEMVDSTKVKASFKNGVLEIVLPRAEQSKQRKIQIATS